MRRFKFININDKTGFYYSDSWFKIFKNGRTLVLSKEEFRRLVAEFTSFDKHVFMRDQYDKKIVHAKEYQEKTGKNPVKELSKISVEPGEVYNDLVYYPNGRVAVFIVRLLNYLHRKDQI